MAPGNTGNINWMLSSTNSRRTCAEIDCRHHSDESPRSIYSALSAFLLQLRWRRRIRLRTVTTSFRDVCWRKETDVLDGGCNTESGRERVDSPQNYVDHGDQDAEMVALSHLLPLLDSYRHPLPQEEINSYKDLYHGQQTCNQRTLTCHKDDGNA